MKTEPRRYEARSLEDLALPLQLAFEQALKSGSTAPFEVILPAGVLSGISLSLTDPTGRLPVTLRGAGPAPTVLDDLPIRLDGSDVRLENLVFRGGRRVAPLLDVAIGRGLVLEGVSFLDNRRSTKEEPTLVRVVSSHRTGGKPIRMHNAWFIGNRLEGEGSLLRFETRAPDDVTEAVFENVAFLENDTDPVLAPDFTHAIRFRSCTVIGSDRPFLWIRSPVTQVAFEGGLLALPSLGALVRRDARATPPDGGSSARLKGVSLYAKGTDLTGLILEDTDPRPLPPLASGGDACRKEALAGSVPDVGWIARAYGISG
ncbi:MAG: hypothetical protein JXB39_04975 [Deltaproteobacteria bacterium]|nr:hypothetical protein [Deltaproteobacteria bacterium]